MNLYREADNTEVTLPATLTDFRGDRHLVSEISEDSSAGRSGRVLVNLGGGHVRTLYPTVFACYIADVPRAEVKKSEKPKTAVR